MRRTIITWIVLLMLLCLPALIIWQSVIRIQSLGQRIIDEYSYLNDRFEQGQEMKRLKTEYALYADSVPKLQALSISEGHEVDFVTSVETMAANHHVTETLNMNFDNITEQGQLDVIPLTLLLQGHYADVVMSIDALSNLPAAVTVKHIELNPLGNNQAADTSAIIEGYVFRAPASMSAHPSAPPINTAPAPQP